MLRHKTELPGIPKHTPHLANFQTTSNSSNKNNKTINTNFTSGSPLDALPKQFVISMKKLFDILDDRHCGFVKFSDIEKGWQDDGCKELPHGVIESLRKVTPTSGFLSFERFCAGLKICLLRNQAEGAERLPDRTKQPSKSTRSPSAPLLEIENPRPNTRWSAASHPTTATVRPQNVVSTQRALSLPQLSPDSDVGRELEMKMGNSGAVMSGVSTYISPPAPPKPPRSAAVAASVPKSSGVSIRSNKIADKREIRQALQNWQMGVLLNEMDNTNESAWKHFPPYRGCADGGSSSTNESSVPLYAKKSSNSGGNTKRREPRRHTLQGGIDYNMLKRLKQYEEERAVLLLGLNAVDKARDWYIQQLALVHDKLQYLGRMGDTHTHWSEVKQEHLNFQRARVLEVNRNLASLADTWERVGFPTHFNLALSSAPSRCTTGGSALVESLDRLRQQNRNLADEVNLKSDRIALLEGEKQSLTRELFLLQQHAPMSVPGRVGSGLMGVLSQASPVCSSSSGGLGDADVAY